MHADLTQLAIAMAAAGVLAGLPARSAQACDNDRYPCPVVAQPQEADAAVRSPPSRKKASRAAPQDEKARAKAERQTSQAQSQTNPAAQEQAANAASRKGRGVVPARNEEAGRNKNPAAAAASLVRPDAARTGAQGAAGEPDALTDDAIPTVPASGVKIVDPNEVNELDLVATLATPAESSWLRSLLATLGAALAAASTVRFLFG
jgi:hypothetical protein